VSLSELFMLYGQAGYRRIERRCLERVLDANDRVVIAVGGGIVSEPETSHLLLDRCFTVWVRAEPEEHMGRVVAQGDFRPMEGSAEAMDDLKRILAAREPLYRKADAVVDTSGADPALAAQLRNWRAPDGDALLHSRRPLDGRTRTEARARPPRLVTYDTHPTATATGSFTFDGTTRRSRWT
jgi:shikimate kinase